MQKLIDTLPLGMSLAEWISNNLNRIRQLRVLLAVARRKSEEARKAHEEAQVVFQKEIAHLQMSCKHEETTHHTGYEDSYTDCDICGKTL